MVVYTCLVHLSHSFRVFIGFALYDTYTPPFFFTLSIRLCFRVSGFSLFSSVFGLSFAHSFLSCITRCSTLYCSDHLRYLFFYLFPPISINSVWEGRGGATVYLVQIFVFANFSLAWLLLYEFLGS